MSTTMMQGSSEVLSVLSEQHEQLKALMQQVVSCPVQDRQEVFDDVRHLLAAHEAAEVEVVHPLARRDLGPGDAVVAARLAEGGRSWRSDRETGTAGHHIRAVRH